MESIFTEINYPAVLVASVVYYLLGAAWYSPALFAKPWMEVLGKKKEDFNPVPIMFITSFMTILMSVFVLEVFVILVNSDTPLFGAFLGALISVGFVLTTSGNNALYAGRPVKLLMIDFGYVFFGFVISGIILSVWR